MPDQERACSRCEADAELERDLGLRDALLTLWNPSGQPVSISWDDSSIVTADEHTRTRLVQTHQVIHALLRGDHADGARRLAHMTSLMAVFTALRSVTLASELLWNAPPPTWRAVLTQARKQTLETNAEETNEARTGADSLLRAIRSNLDGQRRQRILDCIAETAATQVERARQGFGCFGAAVYVAALRATSSGTPEELIEEHSALIVALAHGQAVTHRDGRLVVDG